jgi:hypothetical protein
LKLIVKWCFLWQKQHFRHFLPKQSFEKKNSAKWPKMVFGILSKCCFRQYVCSPHAHHFYKKYCRAVDIFQIFCRAVAIRAVIHFCLRNASARQDMYGILFWFLSRFIYFCHLLEQCRAIEILVSSSFFEQMNFEKMTPLCFLPIIISIPLS